MDERHRTRWLLLAVTIIIVFRLGACQECSSYSRSCGLCISTSGCAFCESTGRCFNASSEQADCPLGQSITSNMSCPTCVLYQDECSCALFSCDQCAWNAPGVPGCSYDPTLRKGCPTSPDGSVAGVIRTPLKPNDESPCLYFETEINDPSLIVPDDNLITTNSVLDDQFRIDLTPLRLLLLDFRPMPIVSNKRHFLLSTNIGAPGAFYRGTAYWILLCSIDPGDEHCHGFGRADNTSLPTNLMVLSERIVQFELPGYDCGNGRTIPVQIQLVSHLNEGLPHRLAPGSNFLMPEDIETQCDNWGPESRILMVFLSSVSPVKQPSSSSGFDRFKDGPAPIIIAAVGGVVLIALMCYIFWRYCLARKDSSHLSAPFLGDNVQTGQSVQNQTHNLPPGQSIQNQTHSNSERKGYLDQKHVESNQDILTGDDRNSYGSASSSSEEDPTPTS